MVSKPIFEPDFRTPIWQSKAFQILVFQNDVEQFVLKQWRKLLSFSQIYQNQKFPSVQMFLQVFPHYNLKNSDFMSALYFFTLMLVLAASQTAVTTPSQSDTPFQPIRLSQSPVAQSADTYFRSLYPSDLSNATLSQVDFNPGSALYRALYTNNLTNYFVVFSANGLSNPSIVEYRKFEAPQVGSFRTANEITSSDEFKLVDQFVRDNKKDELKDAVVESVARQVVAGYNYRIIYNAQGKRYAATVFRQQWTNKTQLLEFYEYDILANNAVARDQVRVGGFKPVTSDWQQKLKIADQTARKSRPDQLKDATLQNSEVQVVAGLNFRLLYKSPKGTFQPIVYIPFEGPASLTSWTVISQTPQPVSISNFQTNPIFQQLNAEVKLALNNTAQFVNAAAIEQSKYLLTYLSNGRIVKITADASKFTPKRRLLQQLSPQFQTDPRTAVVDQYFRRTNPSLQGATLETWRSFSNGQQQSYSINYVRPNQQPVTLNVTRQALVSQGIAVPNVQPAVPIMPISPSAGTFTTSTSTSSSSRSSSPAQTISSSTSSSSSSVPAIPIYPGYTLLQNPTGNNTFVTIQNLFKNTYPSFRNSQVLSAQLAENSTNNNISYRIVYRLANGSIMTVRINYSPNSQQQVQIQGTTNGVEPLPVQVVRQPESRYSLRILDGGRSPESFGYTRVSTTSNPTIIMLQNEIKRPDLSLNNLQDAWFQSNGTYILRYRLPNGNLTAVQITTPQGSGSTTTTASTTTPTNTISTTNIYTKVQQIPTSSFATDPEIQQYVRMAMQKDPTIDRLVKATYSIDPTGNSSLNLTFLAKDKQFRTASYSARNRDTPTTQTNTIVNRAPEVLPTRLGDMSILFQFSSDPGFKSADTYVRNNNKSLSDAKVMGVWTKKVDNSNVTNYKIRYQVGNKVYDVDVVNTMVNGQIVSGNTAQVIPIPIVTPQGYVPISLNDAQLNEILALIRSRAPYLVNTTIRAWRNTDNTNFTMYRIQFIMPDQSGLDLTVERSLIGSKNVKIISQTEISKPSTETKVQVSSKTETIQNSNSAPIIPQTPQQQVLVQNQTSTTITTIPSNQGATTTGSSTITGTSTQGQQFSGSSTGVIQTISQQQQQLQQQQRRLQQLQQQQRRLQQLQQQKRRQQQLQQQQLRQQLLQQQQRRQQQLQQQQLRQQQLQEQQRRQQQLQQQQLRQQQQQQLLRQQQLQQQQQQMSNTATTTTTSTFTPTPRPPPVITIQSNTTNIKSTTTTFTPQPQPIIPPVIFNPIPQPTPTYQFPGSLNVSTTQTSTTTINTPNTTVNESTSAQRWELPKFTPFDLSFLNTNTANTSSVSRVENTVSATTTPVITPVTPVIQSNFTPVVTPAANPSTTIIVLPTSFYPGYVAPNVSSNITSTSTTNITTLTPTPTPTPTLTPVTPSTMINTTSNLSRTNLSYFDYTLTIPSKPVTPVTPPKPTPEITYKDLSIPSNYTTYYVITDYMTRADFAKFDRYAREKLPELRGSSIVIVWVVNGTNPGYKIRYEKVDGNFTEVTVTQDLINQVNNTVIINATQQNNTNQSNTTAATTTTTTTTNNNINNNFFQSLQFRTAAASGSYVEYKNYQTDMFFKRIDDFARTFLSKPAGAVIEIVWMQVLPNGTFVRIQYILADGSKVQITIWSAMNGDLNIVEQKQTSPAPPPPPPPPPMPVINTTNQSSQTTTTTTTSSNTYQQLSNWQSNSTIISADQYIKVQQPQLRNASITSVWWLQMPLGYFYKIWYTSSGITIEVIVSRSSSGSSYQMVSTNSTSRWRLVQDSVSDTEFGFANKYARTNMPQLQTASITLVWVNNNGDYKVEYAAEDGERITVLITYNPIIDRYQFTLLQPTRLLSSVYGPDPLCAYFRRGLCAQCKSRTYIDRASGRCKQISPSCQSFDNITGNCFSCFQGYTLFNSVCTLTSDLLPPFCLTITNNGRCTSCTIGYTLTLQGRCRPTKPNCLSETMDGRCTNCVLGTYLLDGNCLR